MLEVLGTQSCLTLCDPMDSSPPGPSEFPRQEYWNGLPFSAPGDLPDPGIKPPSPVLLALQVDSLPSVPPRKPTILTTSQFKERMDKADRSVIMD